MTKRPFYRRWYAIPAAILLLSMLAIILVVTPIGALVRAPYRHFYIPSEAMNPTLLENDRLLARMYGLSELRRGTVVLVDVGGPFYVERIAGVAGDRIEMIDGDLYINGERVPRRLVGEEPYQDHEFRSARRYVERFPGETGSHEIYDLGRTAGDDFALMTVPPGHVFLLGDNRDRSADSRFPRDAMGVGLLPVSDIVGVPELIYWRSGSGFVRIRLNAD